MYPSLLPESPVKKLIAFLSKLVGSEIQEIELGPDTIRVAFKVQEEGMLKSQHSYLHLVLEGDPKFYYLSYTQIADTRLKQTDPKTISNLKLYLQAAEEGIQNTIVLFCHALESIEGGELHFSLKHFQVYDEHFGKIEIDLLPD